MINLFRKARKYYIKTFYIKGERNIFSERPAPHKVILCEDNNEFALNGFNFSYHSDRKEALRMVEYVLNLYDKDFEIVDDQINII